MSAKPNKDHRIIGLLTQTLVGLSDFRGKDKEAEQYATEVVAAVRASAEDVDGFRDQVMGIVANVVHLDGELTASEITPVQLAAMELTEMLSRKQKRAQQAFSRRRAKEQTDFDKTSLMCEKCSLVRGDRININELALDSEENGSHFDYNFDNICNCSHSSSSTDDDEEDEEKDAQEKVKGDAAEEHASEEGAQGAFDDSARSLKRARPDSGTESHGD